MSLRGRISGSFAPSLSRALAACMKQDKTSFKKSEGNPEPNVRDLASDIGTLLHSNCTKLSIAARPPRTEDAVIQCIKDLEKLLPAFESLCKMVQSDTHSAALADFILKQSKYALTGLSLLVDAVCEDPVSEARLSQTAILWESCIELQKTPTPLLLVSAKVAEVAQMVDDAVEDVDSWAAGEADGNLDFDLEDSDDDSVVQESGQDTGEAKDKVDDAEVTRQITLLKRIKLLLVAINKRRINDATTTEELNVIYRTCSQLVIEVDDWAAEIQEAGEAVLLAELEKAVVLRVEELLDGVTHPAEAAWQTWSENFRSRWLENVREPSKSKVQHYTCPPCYSIFMQQNLKPLLPCLIDGLIDEWQSAKEWRQQVGDGVYIPDYQYLKKHYGDHPVSVTYWNAGQPKQTLFTDFLIAMEAGEQVYARDIHLKRQYPEAEFYKCPPIFQDDWLNFKLETQGLDDYKFVYIGGHETRTKLHKDVVASHSWSSNLTGIKHWSLIPPSVANFLYSFDGDEIVEDIYLQDPITVARYPHLQKVRDAAIVVEQKPGQTIFVPSTWYHQVVNIGPTLSINHNWINAASLNSIYQNLVTEMHQSEEAIIDLKHDNILDEQGFAAVVEELTLENAGMNWDTFFGLIKFRLKHESCYISTRLRPPESYEKQVIYSICQDWQQLEVAKLLPEVGQLVESILSMRI